MYRSRLSVESIAKPAAGTDWSSSASFSDEIRILSVSADFATSAVVANRWPTLKIADQSGLTLAYITAASSQSASIGWSYCWFILNRAAGAGPNIVSQPLPDIWLPVGATIKSVTSSIDVGDTWNNIVILTERRPSHGEREREREQQLAMLEQILHTGN